MRGFISIAFLAIVLLSVASTAYENDDGDEICGMAAEDSYTWTAQDFAGFYYDPDHHIGAEMLAVTLTPGTNQLIGDDPYGVLYRTAVQVKDFGYDKWGAYKIIGFLGEGYFAGYIENSDDAGKNLLFMESTDGGSLSHEQLEMILMDDNAEQTITSSKPLELEEGYELSIDSLNADAGVAQVELSKDGQSVDVKVLSNLTNGIDVGTEDNGETYYYKKDVGAQKDLVIIAVNIKSISQTSEQNSMIVNGVWQISDTPVEIKADTEFDNMSISTVDGSAGIIEMNNKDNTITLARNTDIVLMGNIHIKTDDSDTLRYYLCKTI